MGDLDSQVSAHLCTLLFAHVMHYDQTLRPFSLLPARSLGLSLSFADPILLSCAHSYAHSLSLSRAPFLYCILQDSMLRTMRMCSVVGVILCVLVVLASVLLWDNMGNHRFLRSLPPILSPVLSLSFFSVFVFDQQKLNMICCLSVFLAAGFDRSTGYDIHPPLSVNGGRGRANRGSSGAYFGGGGHDPSSHMSRRQHVRRAVSSKRLQDRSVFTHRHALSFHRKHTHIHTL